MFVEHSMISIALGVVHVTDGTSEPIKPCSWRLLQAIQRFLESTYLSNCLIIHKSRRNFHINFFLQITMKKNILDIQLMKRPPKIRCTRNQCPYCAHFCHWCKALIIVNPIRLTITFCNQPGLVPVHLSLRSLFHSKHPLTSHSLLFDRE